jgi:hypothetical protein
MERATETGFQVADHDVNPTEIRPILAMAAINDHWLMNAAHLCHSTKASRRRR